jgi:hypothetical protein
MSDTLPILSTSHRAFHEPVLQFTPSQDGDDRQPTRTLCLRGVNLSSTAKYPSLPARDRDAEHETTSREQRDMWREEEAGMKSHLYDGMWEEAEAGGRDGWFVGRPLRMEGIDVSRYRGQA